MVPCECTHQCLFQSFLGRHDCKKITGNMQDFRCLLDHATRLPGDMCTILDDVIKTVPLPSSREPGASTCNVFRRIHTVHVWLDRAVLTRVANVWKRQSFLISHHWPNSCAFSAGNMLRKNFHPLVCFCTTLDYHAQIEQCAPPNLSLALILIKVLLKYVPEGPIDYKSTVVQGPLLLTWFNSNPSMDK